MEGGGGGGGGAGDLCRRMSAQRMACERHIADGRERTAAAASAFSAALLSARSLANNTISHRGKLNGLKDQLRRLEADLAEALSIQVNKGSKHKLIGESILNSTATNEQLRSLVMDQRARRAEYANAISNQLEGKNNLGEAIIWYNKFLGFQVVGGEGVKLVFNKIDMKSPDDEYLFCIKLNKDIYSLLQCVPLLKDYKELMKDLNCTNESFFNVLITVSCPGIHLT